MSRALDEAALRSRFEALRPFLDEPSRRRWAAAEACALGRGGVRLVAAVTGLSRNTVRAGLRELQEAASLSAAPAPRQRRPGAGRKRVTSRDPALLEHLEALFEPTGTAGATAALRWTCLSLRQLAALLTLRGHRISAHKVTDLLRQHGYRLQARDQPRPGFFHPQRHAQFEHINELAGRFLRGARPVVSLDAHKLEACGEDRPAGATFPPTSTWKRVDPDHDTAVIAVEALRSWWSQMGQLFLPGATELLVLTSLPGRDPRFVRLWQAALQRWADESRLHVHVGHVPPGTSRWQRIDERLTSAVTHAWPHQPKVRHEVVVERVGAPGVETGRPFVLHELTPYLMRLAADDPELGNLRIEAGYARPEWNYTVLPRS